MLGRDHPPGRDLRGPEVKVVGPARNPARFRTTRLLSRSPQPCPWRIVVVHTGSSAATQAMAERAAKFVLDVAPERPASSNFDARSHPAESLGFSETDTVSEPTVVREAVAPVRGSEVERGRMNSGIVGERTVGTGFWVSVRALEHSARTRAGSVDAWRFPNGQVWKRSCRCTARLTAPEDPDLGRPAGASAIIRRDDDESFAYIEPGRNGAHHAVGVRSCLAEHGTRERLDASRQPGRVAPRKPATATGTGFFAPKAEHAGTIFAVCAGQLSLPTSRLYPLGAAAQFFRLREPRFWEDLRVELGASPRAPGNRGGVSGAARGRA